MPMGQQVFLTPGESTPCYIYVINPQDSTEDFNYRVSIIPYGVTGEDYDIDIISETNQTLIKDWIVIDEPTGTVSPGETRRVDLTINVPENAPGGGQYSAIVVSSDGEDSANSEEGNVAITFSYEMASIIYADVAGETVHAGSLVSHYLPNFSTTSNVSLSTTFENHGNVHETAVISLVVSNLFSGEEIFSSEDSETNLSEVIMPSTTRHLVRELSNLPSLGVVTVKETIEYMGEVSNFEERVLICPLWFLILVGATILTLLAAIIARLFKFHSKTKTLPEEDFED